MEWTLLLNSTFEPLKVITWKKAVIMVMLEKVEVIQEYERFIRGVSLALRLPAVIRLNRFIKRRTPIVKFSRQNLYVRDGRRCQYCGTPFEHKYLTYDHVIPRSKGGQTEWTNVVTCCLACNLKYLGRLTRACQPPSTDWLSASTQSSEMSERSAEMVPET